MAKIVFLSTIFLFVSLGVSSYFFIDVNDMSRFTHGDIAPSVTENDYAGLVLKDDFTIRSIVNRVVKDCAKGDKECITLGLYKFFLTDINVIEDNISVIKSPRLVLNDRQGTSNDLALLFASFLENAGVKSRLAFLDNSTYVYACGVNLLKLYGKIIADIREVALASRDVNLRRGQAWAVDLSASSMLTIDILAKADKAFDMLLFKNKVEMNAYIKNKDGRYIEDCSQFNVGNIERSCLATRGSVLLFISRDDNNTFKGSVYKGGLLLSDLDSSMLSGESCVPIDFTISGEFKYPAISDVSLINALIKAP